MRNTIHLTVCLVLTTMCGLAQADTIAYTNQSTFMNDLVGSAQTLDFESQSPGATVSSGGALGGITFSYDFGSVLMQVASGWSTTSDFNYLGTDDGDIFQAGDEFTMSFAPSSAIGLFIISADEMWDGDVVLEATLANNTLLGVSAVLDASSSTELGDGSYAFFLGLITTDGPITSAQLSMPDEVTGAFVYNVDDITFVAVPTPSSFAALIGMGAVGLIAVARRRRGQVG